MKKYVFIALILLTVAAGFAQVKQAQEITIQPGESVQIACAVCPTCQVPTDTPVSTATAIPSTPVPTDTPTATPVPVSTNTPTNMPTSTAVLPTATPPPQSSIYAMLRTSPNDWATVQSLGVNVVDYIISPSTADTEIISRLDLADSLNLRVILHIWDSSRTLKKPWYLDSGSWQITPRGDEILNLVQGHSALWAIYALHEPLEPGPMHVSSDDQRALYALLKSKTNALVYTDVGELAGFFERGVSLSDGMFDIAATFRHRFVVGQTSQWAYNRILPKILGDIAVRDSEMPNTQILFQIQTYANASGSPAKRLPTTMELAHVRDFLCVLGEPAGFYLWNPRASYNTTLEQAPHLWPVVQSGCNGVIPLTPEPTDAPTETPTGAPESTNTPAPTLTSAPQDTPAPTGTPTALPSGGTIIDHTCAGVPDLDFLNNQSVLFAGASWRARIEHRLAIYTSRITSANVSSCSDYQCKIASFRNRINGYWAGVVKPCYGDIFAVTDPAGLAQYYINEMNKVSEKTVLTTIVLTSAAYGRSGENAKSQVYNDYLRAYCLAAPGCVLWDIADIISDGGACSENGYEVMCARYDEGDHKHPNPAGADKLARGLLWALWAADR
jgi:hypothetical protein